VSTTPSRSAASPELRLHTSLDSSTRLMRTLESATPGLPKLTGASFKIIMMIVFYSVLQILQILILIYIKFISRGYSNNSFNTQNFIHQPVGC
jgi:hypothetical protein